MMADLQRVGVKLFSADAPALRPHAVVPVFHRWIQTHAIDGHTLIDVADYDHVPGGPGIVLVAHEGIFSLGRDDARMALTYTRRTLSGGGLADRLRRATQSALRACQLLEAEGDLGEPLRFRGDEMEIFTNDRLRAPNTPSTYAAFQAPLNEFLRAVYGDQQLTITPQTDSQERLGVHVRARLADPVRTLLQRIESL